MFTFPIPPSFPSLHPPLPPTLPRPFTPPPPSHLPLPPHPPPSLPNNAHSLNGAVAEGESAVNSGGVESPAAHGGMGGLSARGRGGDSDGDGDGAREGEGGELASFFASRASAFISRSRAREDAVRGIRGGGKGLRMLPGSEEEGWGGRVGLERTSRGGR